ncbi:hypothetical protein N7481_008422 [Penicillium waksmanii]|uniref:uncharacterized protein n=1 Tax=Penicillium waksmanii TaxID=69791 RepID=UPI0025498096|nr:uncharacterized protein N7481_008422 [Penicillium waksmanii]KAJ5981124.1 hypothetical protein N7481_008422 [Penicillium waksmanii]
MSSFSDFPSEIDYGTTSADPFNDRQWRSDLASLTDIEINAFSDGMEGGYPHEEPMNPFSSPHDMSALYNEDATIGLNDTFVPNEATTENHIPSRCSMATLNSPFYPNTPITQNAGPLNNVLSAMAKEFAVKSASMLDTMEDMKRNFDYLSSQVQDLKSQFGVQVQELKSQVHVASNDINHLQDQLALVRSNEKESSLFWASITSRAKEFENK